MNKKLLVTAVALIAVAMLATPMVGTAEACRWRRRSQPFEATFVILFRYSRQCSGLFNVSQQITLPETEPIMPGRSA